MKTADSGFRIHFFAGSGGGGGGAEEGGGERFEMRWKTKDEREKERAVLRGKQLVKSVEGWLCLD